MRRTQAELEAHIWAVLSSFHRGHPAGIRNDDLARQVGVSPRRLREAIAALVRRDGQLIGSHPDHGVFAIETAQDHALADSCLAHETFPTMDRRRALERAWRAHNRQQAMAQQPSLFEATP